MTMHPNRHCILLTLTLAAAAVLSSCGGGGGGGSAGSPPPPPTVQRPAAPTSVLALASSSSVTVSWSAVSAATSYDVFRTVVTGTSYTAVATSTPSTFYRDVSVSTGSTYYYVVRAKNSAGTSANSAEVSATPQPLGSGSALVQGLIQYEDKEYDVFGFTGATMLKPVRHAGVDLVLQGSSTPILSTRTTATGYYSFSLSTNLGSPHYVRVNAEASAAFGRVNVNTLTNQLYGVVSLNFTPVANTATDLGLTVYTTNAAGGAFNILDVYTSSTAFVSSLALSSVPTVTVFWPSALASSGTYYCSSQFAGDCAQGRGIYVLSEPYDAAGYDTDEYDDDVLWHEYGHFVGDAYSIDDSPGGAHSFASNDMDLRLAWSEGWSDFFQAAVKNWLNETDPSLLSISTTTVVPLSQYVDTATLPGYYYNSITLSNPETGITATVCMNDECMYSSNEIAVANVLWTLVTSPVHSFGMTPVWDVFSSLPTATMTVAPVNLESFWDEWKHQRSATFAAEQGEIEFIYGDRSIFYREDAADIAGGAGGDDTQNAAVLVSVPSSTQRFLFRSDGTADVDYFVISGTIGSVYTVGTTSMNTLKNGADTKITVYRSDGTTMVTPLAGTNPNDNYFNNASYAGCDGIVISCPVNGDQYNSLGTWTAAAPLASRVTFTAPATDSYLIRVEATPKPARPVSAGRYGTYTLTVSSP